MIQISVPERSTIASSLILSAVAEPTSVCDEEVVGTSCHPDRRRLCLECIYL